MKLLRDLSISLFILAFIFASNAYAKTVYILNFNDFHLRIYNNKSYKTPGMVFFMNAILSEIKKDGKENVILVSGGDNYQGITISSDTKGAPANDMFKELGVAFSAVGNHEFDWGQKHFKKWQKDGNFTYLAANVISKKTGKTPEWVAPYKVTNVNGVKIAFIGLSTLETTIKTSVWNLSGIKIENPWVSAQYWIDYLKAGRDSNGVPDIIVALTHIPSIQDKITGSITGDELDSLCCKTNGLNAIISAHSHKTVCGKKNGIVVVQAECHGKKYGVIKVDIDDKTRKLKSIEAKVCSVPVNVELLPENNGEKILEKYSEIEKKYSKIVGKTEKAFPYDGMIVNALGIYVAKLMTEATTTQLAFINGFGIRGGLEKGDITVGDLFRILPFNNTIVSMKLSGKAIKAVMEHGLDGNVGQVQFYGLKVVFDHSKPSGERVISMTLNNGKKIEMNQCYSACVFDFMYSGGDGYKFGDATNVKKHSDLFVRDILLKCIEKEKELTLPKPDCLVDEGSDRELKEAA